MYTGNSELRLETKMDIANEIRKLQTNESRNIQNHKETFKKIRTDFGAWSGFFIRYLFFQSVVRIAVRSLVR